MGAFFTKYALTIKLSALVFAAIAVVCGVSVYAAIRANGQGDDTMTESPVSPTGSAAVLLEETTEEPTTEAPATEVAATEADPSAFDQNKVAQEVAQKAENVATPDDEKTANNDDKRQEDDAQNAGKNPGSVEPDGPPVIVEPEKPTEPEDITGSGDTTEPETVPAPSEPVLPQSPVKYQLYRTLSHSGFSKNSQDKWSGTDQYYNDGKAVDSWKGIDVSYAQGQIDFEAVKAAGIDFVIIRVGARGYESGSLILDDWFAKNIENASRAGLDIGVYFYSQAVTEEEAIEEAKMVLDHIGRHPGCAVTYPVIMDVEGVNGEARIDKISDVQLNKNVTAFCEVIRQAGYYPMIYADQNYAENRLDFSQLPYDYWMAAYRSYNTTFGVEIPFTMWQYTSTGSVSGVSGDVDRNVSLVDYAAYLRKNGWNNLK